jgi:pimeloyl-ACP methyl ester carboxylesterase
MAIAYSRAGSGPALVLVHGLGGSRRIWEPVTERLAAERDVIAVDLPGFGDSDVLPDGIAPTPANLAEALGDLCSKLELENFHLAGNSLGAWVALELAKSGRAASVCAISPAGLWRAALGPRRFNSHALAHRLGPLFSGLLASPGMQARFLRTTIGHPERLSATEGRALISDWLNAPGYDAANDEMRSHVFEHPELVKVPTTIARGTLDRLVSPPRRERMPPGATYIELPGVGHTPTWDDPELVARLLLDSSSAQDQASSGRSSPGQAPVAL